jgi:hypothetical protein
MALDIGTRPIAELVGHVRHGSYLYNHLSIRFVGLEVQRL